MIMTMMMMMMDDGDHDGDHDYDYGDYGDDDDDEGDDDSLKVICISSFIYYRKRIKICFLINKSCNIFALLKQRIE